jgi:hypothetical protein
MTAATRERPTRVVPVRRSEAVRLATSRRTLSEFLVAHFEKAFGQRVDETMFETFPDGLCATLYVDGTCVPSHNLWGVNMASALSDAGVEVQVVVRSSSERFAR